MALFILFLGGLFVGLVNRFPYLSLYWFGSLFVYLNRLSVGLIQFVPNMSVCCTDYLYSLLLASFTLVQIYFSVLSVGLILFVPDQLV